MEGLKDNAEGQPELNNLPVVDLEVMDTDEKDSQGPEHLPDPDDELAHNDEAAAPTSPVIAGDGGSSSQNADGSLEENGSEEDGDGSGMSQEVSVHPLTIPNVIEEVLKHLPAKDIDNLRLVSRTWNTEACTVLRNKRIIVFLEPEAVRVYNEAMGNTTKFPHAQFELCISDFTRKVDEDLRIFWEKFGTHIKSLEFRQTPLFLWDLLEVLQNSVPNVDRLFLKYLPRNVPLAAPVMTHLQQIRIRSVKILRLASLPSATNIATERLTDLLKTFPNLEVIDFLHMRQPTTKSKVSNVLIEVLGKAEVFLPKLKRINLNLEVNSDGLDAMANKRFPLERLQLTLADGVKASSFKNLIVSLRSTLVELKVSFPENYTNFHTFLNQNKSMHPDECVQLLTRLRSLNMANFKGSINFVQKLPELEYLEFTTDDLATSVPFGFKQIGSGFMRPNQDHSLKGLKIVSNTPGSPKLAETLMLDSISRCFPFLNCLYVDGIDDDGLGVMYRNLPFLSEVELYDAKCTDQGLTGIPLEICNDMLETSTYMIVQAEKYRSDLFIGSLQFLRKLTIIAQNISNAAVALGLVDCKNMRVLKFGSALISDTGIIFITDRFCRQLEVLDVTECTAITEQSKFYAREKFRGELKVSVSSQDSCAANDAPAPHFPPGRVEPAAPFNPDRAMVVAKPKPGSSSSSSSSTTSNYLTPDVEFFEEVSEEEVRELAGPDGLQVIRMMALLPQDQPGRFRIRMIRNALRRNGEFMRRLQRLGVQRFQRLFRAELQAGNRQGREERVEQQEGIDNVNPINRPAGFVGDVFNRPNPNNENVIIGGRLIQRYQFIELEDDGDSEPEADPLPLPPVPPVAEAAEAEGGLVLPGLVPNRLREIYIAEIHRLGLRPVDIEFWLLNRELFEMGEIWNGNVVRNEAGGHALRVELIQGPGGGGAGVAFGFFDDELEGPPRPPHIPPPAGGGDGPVIDIDIDIEAVP